MRYEDIFDTFNKRNVDYVVIGGVAMALHGAVRLTADLDLMISFETENVVKFVEAMDSLGFKPQPPVQAMSLADRGKRDMFIKEKNMTAFAFYNAKEAMGLVDVMVRELVDYGSVKKNSVIARSGDIVIPIASIPDMIKLKTISNRRQDLLDIEALKAIEKK